MPFTPRESQIDEQMIENQINEEAEELLPADTWEFDFDTGELTGRKIDGMDAYGQAMEKALLTERDVYPIYGDSYGSELHLLISDKVGSTSYKESEAIDMAQEAVIYDDRTNFISNITANSHGDEIDLNISIVTDERVSMDTIDLGVNLGG